MYFHFLFAKPVIHGHAREIIRDDDDDEIQSETFARSRSRPLSARERLLIGNAARLQPRRRELRHACPFDGVRGGASIQRAKPDSCCVLLA